MQDEAKQKLDILLAEYKQLRQECYDTIKRQDVFLTATITFGGTVFVISYYFLSARADIFPLFMGLLGPSTILFIGTCWLNAVFQQKRYDMYLREIEVCVTNLLPGIPFQWEKYLGAEHAFEHKKAKRSKNVSFSSQFRLGAEICLGMYLTVPLFMYTAAYFDTLTVSFSEYLRLLRDKAFHVAILIMFLLVYCAFLATVILYIGKISFMQAYISGFPAAPAAKVKKRKKR
ncbi:MAG: hypothetical protein FWF60_00105 [Oscillospiraceae bacterium]|nr:hypothetical protein [Oscillospiraceae bacterium]